MQSDKLVTAGGSVKIVVPAAADVHLESDPPASNVVEIPRAANTDPLTELLYEALLRFERNPPKKPAIILQFPEALAEAVRDLEQRRPPLRGAVKAAIKAYAASGRMLDAALAYAAHGYPVFPLDPKTKAPIPRRDPDPTGKHKDGISGTGGVYKATCDEKQIGAWWTQHPDALIGMPTGERSGVWCLDIDTSEDHADGSAAWGKIVAQHVKIETREHRTATAGRHLVFNYHLEQPIGCSAGGLPKGIDVKGQGGYIAVPPSQRKGRFYTVAEDIDPVDAPAWLLDLIRQGRSTSTATYTGPATTPELERLNDALRHIPNDDLPWEEWTSMGLRIYAATGGKGFNLFDEFSWKSDKYDAAKTQQRWREIKGSPPSRTGARKIFKIALEYGWAPKQRELREAEPTYPAPAYLSIDAARSQIQKRVRIFLTSVACLRSKAETWMYYWFFGLANAANSTPLAEAMLVTTGVGKTLYTVEELVKWLREVTSGGPLIGSKRIGPIIYAVPRLNLGKKILKMFIKHGIDARMFRGRFAPDPDNPGKMMCLFPEAVKQALKSHQDVSKACCKDGKDECIFLKLCRYQGQNPEEGDQPRVWIVASDMLFHAQKMLGEPAAVIIDEAIWQKSIRGSRDDESEWSVAVDSLRRRQPKIRFIGNQPYISGDESWIFNSATINDMRDYFRNRLGEALQQQPGNGGVERVHFAKLSAKDCHEAIRWEWGSMPEIEMRPGMSVTKIEQLARSNVSDDIRHARRIIKVWEALGEMLDDSSITVSGRLTLKQRNGQRVVEWRGIEKIREQYQQPTLMFDATLPPETILKINHPHIEIIANIEVEMSPHTRIRQVQGAPTTAKKLKDRRNCEAVRRYILQRFMETGRQRTLVICQQKFEEYLKIIKMPKGIKVKHFNDVTGDDDYSDVRLLIVAGRTAPGPEAMEALAAALSGKDPVHLQPSANGANWYEGVKHGIRLPDGRGIETSGDWHPDPFVEPVRWQVHEGELRQAIGRGRGVNRTAQSPLDIDLLFDTALPDTVNKVAIWKPPSLLIATATDGVMLMSRIDLVKAWPQLWKNDRAAKRTLEEIGKEPALMELLVAGWQPVNYRLDGPKMKLCVGYFDPSRIPDPRAWLEQHLGPLQFYRNG